MNTFAFDDNRANVNTSLVGGIPLTQQLIDYRAEFRIAPQVQVIRASEVNDAWKRVLGREARYRYVIDTTTI